MAYAAVSCVIQSLEYLLQSMLVILRIRKFEIKKLRTAACQLARLAEPSSSSSDHSHPALHSVDIMGRLDRDMQNLIGPDEMEKFSTSEAMKYTVKDIAQRPAIYINRNVPEMLENMPDKLQEVVDGFEEVAEILEEISLFESDLDKFAKSVPKILEETDLREVHDLSMALPTTHSASNEELSEEEKFSDEMHQYSSIFFATIMAKLEIFSSASAKLKSKTTFIDREATKIKGLCQDLRLLRDFLWDSANLCKNHEMAKHLEKCISGVLSGADNFIEEKLLDMQLKLNTWNINTTMYGSPTQFSLDQILNEDQGIICTLFSTLEATDSLMEKVKTVRDEALGIQNLQSSSILEEVLKPSLLKEDIVVGLDNISNDILYRLVMGQPKLEILPIMGMGGIGKTTLARKIFDHPAVIHFHPRAWITVAQSYKVRDLLLSLFLSVGEPTDGIYEKNNEELEECLYRSLKGRKYLIVMDDIWNINVWDDVKRFFPDDRVGSRIILTSRMKRVAAYVNPEIPPYCMSLLNADESWKLLKERVFGKGSCPPKLVDCGKQIAEKCQGLPLAIVVVAGHLSRIKRTFECWKDVLDKVSLLVETDPEKCLEILALSFNCLPYHLRDCFLYMAAFPEHWQIEVEKLINLWIAEGFLDQKSSSDLQGVGHEILEDLVDRSLVLVGKRSFNGKIKTCCIHDLLRELCLKEAKKEKFIHVIKRDSQGFPSKLGDERRLSFHLESDGDVHLVPSLPLLRSFSCFSIGSGFSPDIFLCHLHFKLLRVLDIGFLRFDHFPNQILQLVLLKYLELTFSHGILGPLSELRNLHTLVINGPWMMKRRMQSSRLHLEYWNMPWLRHLHISPACSLQIPSIYNPNLPYPFTPQFLRTLSIIQFSSCRRAVFGVMPGLRKLGICETKEDYDAGRSSKFLGNLVYLKHLEILKCFFYVQNKAERSNLICGDFPSSIRQLTLSGSRLPWEDMILIAGLPHLEVLKLKNYAFQGRKWIPTEDGFYLLKHLLVDKTDLELWEASGSHFPRLQSLILRSCELLEEIPFSVGEIPTLQLIELHYCSKSAEIAAEEIGSQFDAVKVHIRSNQFMENHPRKEP